MKYAPAHRRARYIWRTGFGFDWSLISAEFMQSYMQEGIK
jgi:hypothetical protein